VISGKTRLLALIGHPVVHSLSPAMHNASFAADGLDFVYVCLDVTPEDLPAAGRGAAALNLRGFNVTMPHKRAMVSLVDRLDEDARVAGAVNTVVIDRDETTGAPTLRGFNTDGGGMVMACREAGIDPADRSVLLLGAGGAAAAIALAFGREGVRHLHVTNRTPEAAEDLANRLRGAGVERTTVHPYDPDALPEADIVVNTTALGMQDEDPLPVPEGYLTPYTAVCDAVYRPGAETRLVRRCRERGVPVVPGDRMLLYQGVLAQRLWTGRDPNVRAMDRAISTKASNPDA
jgi:shikimate dehydrogenase